ncbi:MAG: hypothetical protein LIP01_03215, partial [Tannerellaceae bacterium]|nr:hypothetical protein [Tannerellaceae bacterium]
VQVISLAFICPLAFASETEITQTNEFKPSFHIGMLMHTYVGLQQQGFNTSEAIASPRKWNTEATLYRTRIMAEAHLTQKDYIFIETELTSPLGNGRDKAGSIKILDAQYDHIFADYLKVSAGKILVSHNRNGLQTAFTLMANDFTYFQYPYNMSADSPLQNDLGRDIGVNLSGGFITNKLRYRLGAFTGRRDFEGESSAPVRITGRVEYNFLDIDTYSGTNLGMGKTCTLAGGFNTQGTYTAGGADLFIDCPLGLPGSVTLNTAYSYMTGGNDPEKNIHLPL